MHVFAKAAGDPADGGRGRRGGENGEQRVEALTPGAS